MAVTSRLTGPLAAHFILLRKKRVFPPRSPVLKLLQGTLPISGEEARLRLSEGVGLSVKPTPFCFIPISIFQSEICIFQN